MTTSRRFPFPTLAVVSLATGLLAGCSSTGPFTAGRLPYGGTEIAAQDPFTGQMVGDRRLSGPARESMPAQAPMMAETTWHRPPTAAQEPAAATAFASTAPAGNAHGAAYFEAPEDNPFAEVAPTTAYPMPNAATPVGYETAAAPPETNPFAEVEGQYAAMPAAAIGQSARQAEAGSWQPRASAPVAADEFLPPRR